MNDYVLGDCAVCGHSLPHRMELPTKPLGLLNIPYQGPMITLCDNCPGGKCQPKRVESTVVIIGFSPIRDMTRTDMIDELMAFQRRQLEQITVDRLTTLLVNVRIYDYARQVKAEAGIGPDPEDEGTGLIPVE